MLELTHAIVMQVLLVCQKREHIHRCWFENSVSGRSTSLFELQLRFMTLISIAFHRYLANACMHARTALEPRPHYLHPLLRRQVPSSTDTILFAPAVAGTARHR
eukprot:TRINITY_DN16027_c0_g1_i1.p3 TRINITY_DN16027_c0_g1~~TRINITY_DN16027_c0_g1_i1.p3  ORF type:complete len:104 (-),score=9.07 TRINITY_DN16027_c0_g1_i1:277-588(-)